MRQQVAQKYDNRRNKPQQTSEFVRIDKIGNAWLSAQIRDETHGWSHVNIEYDDEKKEIYVIRNEKAGLYAIWEGVYQKRICIAATATKLGVLKGARMPAQVNGEEITINYGAVDN